MPGLHGPGTIGGIVHSSLDFGSSAEFEVTSQRLLRVGILYEPQVEKTTIAATKVHITFKTSNP